MQNITLEMILSLTVVGSLIILYTGFVWGKYHTAKKRGDSTMALYSGIDIDETLSGESSYGRPQAGQLWYKRAGDNIPFINMDEAEAPCRILSYRACEDPTHTRREFVKYERAGEEHITSIADFYDRYMMDEFNDIKVAVEEEAPEEQLELLVEFEEPVKKKETSVGNVVSIDGKNYVLSPVA